MNDFSDMPLAITRNPENASQADLTNDQLAARLTMQPTTLSALQSHAAALYQQARALAGITAGVDAIWADFQNRALQAVRATERFQPPVREARIALEASALFGDLLSLPVRYPNPLGVYNSPQHGGQIADTPEARALLESRPSTAAWLRARDDAQALDAERQQRQVEQSVRDAPRNFLAMLTARGLDLQVDDDGAIILPPDADASLVQPNELAALREWKPELVHLIRAETAARGTPEPARPTVLA